MKKRRLTAVMIMLVLFLCTFSGCQGRGEWSADLTGNAINFSLVIRTLQTAVFIEKANLKAGIEYPESIKEQEKLVSSLMKHLKKNDEIWNSFLLVADDVCGLLYIDEFYGNKYHDFLVEKLSCYVYEEGLLSIYKKSTEHVPEDAIISSVQNTAYHLNFLSEALSEEEMERFGFKEAIAYYFNFYLPEASGMDGDQKDEEIAEMRGMYSEILCVLHRLGSENEVDFTSIQDLQQQKSRRNFEERYAEDTLYNASMWAMIAMEEHVYHESNQYDTYANQVFCNLKTEEDFYWNGNPDPFMELRFYILNGGDVSGNEFYSNHINEWLDEEIMTLYHQMMGNN
ncbi:MAG: hypothetical protein E7260_08405 [Lachnospiraceae bacterium]|nr:hypothetical protein [Lachnospiraceae bacterium]